MYRFHKWTDIPERMFKTKDGIFMGRNGYQALLKEMAASAVPNSPINSPSERINHVFGLPVFISSLCEPYRRDDGYPLRDWAVRFLRSKARRS